MIIIILFSQARPGRGRGRGRGGRGAQRPGEIEEKKEVETDMNTDDWTTTQDEEEIRREKENLAIQNGQSGGEFVLYLCYWFLMIKLF